MAKVTLQDLSTQLLNESDGNKFAKLKSKLISQYGATDTTQVLEILTTYAREGKLLHWRNFLMTDIIGLIPQGDRQYAAFFEWAITIPNLTYWAVDGLLKTSGQQAYDQLITLATNDQLPVDNRAKAIKSLALHSQQPFDRQLPADPGYWKIPDLRLEELLNWQKNGYQTGAGYTPPATHAALKQPVTALDKIAARLEKKLQERRNSQQDPSNPSDWLIIAADSDIQAIDSKWQLPETYRTFLQNFSPLRVMIDEGDAFAAGLDLYGAGELIGRQDGYAYNSMKQEKILDWPENYLVIADAGGDPFCIDLTTKEGAIYTSAHGMGTWEFELYAASFLEFLDELAQNA
ncbi:SMI1/KNR4 family protein [Chitinophaga pinensis]|uniref:Knr4/Smi1-like domain-containing protein n=1 Tax=Chitinophaga pinensis (strain ATCC 43595 / DSM 2588 / LMG 13176 / NBRC 15968 / NCIMB 11800 / UQM 2034) TaxID=485918 RepID=A0A979G9G9_CHIPD|nr:SMI1/KNR4 family protein [Chitinophaga pinensis]ACU63107.1 hypothetical protein Cpin_5684 [Chitinophaga pinensis DSM 2588]